MAKVIQDITLEVIKPNRFQAIVAKQYDDNSRFLRVSLVNDGEKIEIQKTSTAVINANRIDGESESFVGETNDDGTATLPLNYWMLSLEGNLYCDVSILDADGRKLTSTSFTVLVEKSASGKPSDDPGSDEYTLLFMATENAKEAAALATAAAGNVMEKDQVASVLDVVKKTPIYFGTGTDEDIEASIPVVPGETVYFDESDTSWDDMVADVEALKDDVSALTPDVDVLKAEVASLFPDVKSLKTEIDKKAPAGYGIGKLINFSVASDNDADSILIDQISSMEEQTFKRIVLSFANANSFTNGGGHYYTDIYKLSTNYAMITVKSYQNKGQTLQRVWFDGVLKPWEWVNPPMNRDVEYRTTERWGGYPVYKKLVIHEATETYGKVEGYTDYNIPHGIDGLYTYVDCICKKDTYRFPYPSNAGTTAVKGVDATHIGLRVAGEWSAGNWHFTLTYVKAE